MSEYQWYEFVALDQPLTAKAMAELRVISTRATITPTRFWNEYHWGALKADAAWLTARYFDAHLYFANWGTRRLMLRFPADRVDVQALRPYVPESGPVTLTTTELDGSRHVVLDFVSETDAPDYDEYDDYNETPDSPHSLGALTPLRPSLMEGDLSVAYVAWLLAVQGGAVDDDAVEPLLPDGLATPSAALVALADFLRVDPDLLAAARDGVVETPVTDAALRAWIAALPVTEKDRWLLRAVEGSVRAALLAAYHAQGGAGAGSDTGRTVGDLRARAAVRRAERQNANARPRAKA